MTDEVDVGALTDEQIQSLLTGEPAPAAPESEPVAQAAPEPAPAPEAAPEPAEDAGEHKRRMIDDLREERQRRKELAARLEEMEARQALRDQQLREYLASIQQPQQPQLPDFDSDPIEHLRHQQAEVTKSLQELKAHQEALEQQRQREAGWVAMRQSVQQAESEFAKAKPDYYDAVAWLRSQREQQLASRGASQQQIQQLVSADAVALATQAAQLGHSPAEYAYRVALGQGWQAKAPAPRSAAEPPKSLGGASGRTEDAMPSINDISKMSDKEFDKLFAKMMGGT